MKKHNVFHFLRGPAGGKTLPICLDLSLMSMLDLLVLKNLTQCTSQRLKRPSGAEVMTCSLSLDRSVARSLGRSVARSLGRSVARSVARSLGRSVARSLDRSIARSLDRSLDCSIARLLDRSLDRAIDRSIGRLFARFDFDITYVLGNYLRSSMFD